MHAHDIFNIKFCLWLAARSLGPSPGARFHHFAQSLIPIAACGVFLGLSAITVTMLRAEGFELGFVGPLRALLLGGAAIWSIVLAWKIAGLAAGKLLRMRGNTLACSCRLDRRGKLGCVFLGLAVTGPYSYFGSNLV